MTTKKPSIKDPLMIYQNMRVPEPTLPEFSREQQMVYTSFDEGSNSRESSFHMSDKPTNIQIKNGRRLTSKPMLG